MTWSEIKKAVEEAGVKEDEEISCIVSEYRAGSGKLRRVTLGKSVRLVEELSDEARKEAVGCAA